MHDRIILVGAVVLVVALLWEAGQVPALACTPGREANRSTLTPAQTGTGLFDNRSGLGAQNTGVLPTMDIGELPAQVSPIEA